MSTVRPRWRAQPPLASPVSPGKARRCCFPKSTPADRSADHCLTMTRSCSEDGKPKEVRRRSQEMAVVFLRLWRQVGAGVCCAVLVCVAVTLPSALALPLLLFALLLALPQPSPLSVAAVTACYLALASLVLYCAAVPLRWAAPVHWLVDVGLQPSPDVPVAVSFALWFGACVLLASFAGTAGPGVSSVLLSCFRI